MIECNAVAFVPSLGGHAPAQSILFSLCRLLFQSLHDCSYWTGAVFNWAAADYEALRTKLKAGVTGPLATTIKHLRARDWSVDMSSCATTVCTDSNTVAYLNTEFYAGARTFLKTQLDDLHDQGIAMFSSPSSSDYRLFKFAVVLGDVIRRYIKYPLTTTQGGAQQAWFAGYYADHALYSLRQINPMQVDLGTFSERPLPDNIPVYYDQELTFDTRLVDYFTAAGVYALPGRTFTITRVDSGTGTIKVMINTQVRHKNGLLFSSFMATHEQIGTQLRSRITNVNIYLRAAYSRALPCSVLAALRRWRVTGAPSTSTPPR